MDTERPTWISEHVPEDILNSDLFRFNIKVPQNESPIQVDMSNDIEVEYDRLEEQIDQCSGQYSWWAIVYSEARSLVSLLELKIRIRKGKLTAAAIKSAFENQVRLTDKQISSIVDGDENLVRLEIELVQMQKKVGKLWHMIKAIEMKGEMLRSRAGFKRQEQRHS